VRGPNEQLVTRLAALAVAVLALTAGCNGITNNDGAQAGADGTATVTPAPGPTGQSFVNTGSVPDPQTLATGHATTLSRTNYTVLIRERVTAGNRTVRLDRRQREVARNAERYLLRRERTTRGLPSNAIAPVVSYWFDGSTVVSRVGANGSTLRVYPNTTTGPLRSPSDRDYIERLARAFSLRRANATDGVVYNSTRLTAPESAPSSPYVGRQRNASVTLRLDRQGYVESYRDAFDGTAPRVGEQVRVVREVRFQKVGRTTVTLPEWVGRAREQHGVGDGDG
jgi:hypothetical protein